MMFLGTVHTTNCYVIKFCTFYLLITTYSTTAMLLIIVPSTYSSTVMSLVIVPSTYSTTVMLLGTVHATYLTADRNRFS